MSYATAADLEGRLGPQCYVQLTDDEGTGTANGARAAEALAAAGSEVDSRLAGRYRTPVDVAAEPGAAALLRALTLDLAEHRLHARRPPVPEDIRHKAVEARRLLRDLAAGRAHLPLAQAAAAAGEEAGIVAEVSGEPRVFRRADWAERQPARE